MVLSGLNIAEVGNDVMDSPSCYGPLPEATGHYSLETPSANPLQLRGEVSELSVSQMLWDLLDEASPSEPWDQVTMTGESIWQKARTMTLNSSFSKFWAAMRQGASSDCDLRLGEIACFNGFGSETVKPPSGEILKPGRDHVLSWTRGVSQCAQFDGNAFTIKFFDRLTGAVIGLQQPALNAWTLDGLSYAALQSGASSPYVDWWVESSNTDYPGTGPYRGCLGFFRLSTVPLLLPYAGYTLTFPDLFLKDLSGSALGAASGLLGSYVNASLRGYAAQDDWRLTQVVSGSRLDPMIAFDTETWGVRDSVGVTGGIDEDWENFSVQWDGSVEILTDGIRLATYSDDGSRMWIDINHDDAFDATGPEFTDNNWGQGQAATTGPGTIPLAVGEYKIRIQYEEGGGVNTMQLLALAPETVRFAYLIPSNRTAQPDAVANLQQGIRFLHSFVCDQMNAHGFGRKSFRYETEADGATPKIYTLSVPQTDSYIADDMWGHLLEAADSAGVPVWNRGEVWVLIPESHRQLSDGSIVGGSFNEGVPAFSGADAGFGRLSSERLALLTPAALKDTSSYAGATIPGIGPHPLVQNLSFASSNGHTISSLASSYLGDLARAILKSTGVVDESRNDSNFKGSVLGSGRYGLRGVMYPDLFPQNDCQLSYDGALALNTSRYVCVCDSGSPGLVSCPATAWGDETKPTVSILTPAGPTALVNGQVEVEFSVSDNKQLASAILRRNAVPVDELPLSGTSGTFSMRSSYYTPDVSEEFIVSVLDANGNHREAVISLTPTSGPNMAPQPFLEATPSRPTPGRTVLLSASQTNDPDDPLSSLQFFWDLDGNGTFEVGPSPADTISTTFVSLGSHLVRMRAVDPSGNAVSSLPVVVTVREQITNIAGSTGAPQAMWLSASPNPSEGSARISFGLSEASAMELNVYDVSGRVVRHIASGERVVEAGTHALTWPGDDDNGHRVGSGVYLLRLTAGRNEATERVVLLRGN
jgi:hypothetical protein